MILRFQLYVSLNPRYFVHVAENRNQSPPPPVLVDGPHGTSYAKFQT